MPRPKEPNATLEPGALASPCNDCKPDSVINNKYIPDETGEDNESWIPSTYLWAFDSSGIQIARAVTHMRDSIECFLKIHKANPAVALITSRPMNLREAKETILWKRETE